MQMRHLKRVSQNIIAEQKSKIGLYYGKQCRGMASPEPRKTITWTGLSGFSKCKLHIERFYFLH